MPAHNPWEGLIKDYSKQAKVASSRAEAYQLAYALRDIGESHLGAAALIAFEWLQRPEKHSGGEDHLGRLPAIAVAVPTGVEPVFSD